MKNTVDNLSKSKVILMCGPAGAGKSTLAKKFESTGMTILSYDEESFKRGLNEHPLPQEVLEDIKTYLDEKLISLIMQNMKENDGYSGSSSAKGTDAGRQKKARQKELLEEYLEKRAQMKEFQQEVLEEKIAKQELERSRLTKAWSSKRQIAMASNAYDANVMTETATGSEV